MNRFILLLTFLGLSLAGNASASSGVAIGVCVHPDSFPPHTPMFSEISVEPGKTTELYICARGWGDSLAIGGWEGSLKGPAMQDSTLQILSTELYPKGSMNLGDNTNFKVDLGTCVSAPAGSVVVLAKISLLPLQGFDAVALMLRGYDGQCAVNVASCSGAEVSTMDAYKALYKNINIYGNDPYPRPEPPHGHAPFPNRVQPVVAAIGVVTAFRTPFKAECWSYSIVDVAIEQTIVGNPGATFSFITRGAVRQAPDGHAAMVEGFPAYMYQYFKVGDRIIFAAAALEENRRKILYYPFPFPYMVRWSEILLQSKDTTAQPTFKQVDVAPVLPSPSEASVDGLYNTDYLQRTLEDTGHTLQERIDELIAYYGG